MNRKLKMALRGRSNEQGFAIPAVVGLGLAMLLVSVTMIVRSQGDQVTASAQKATFQSLGVAETGITQVESFLGNNRRFINKNHPWTTSLESLKDPCISGDLYDKANKFNDWITVGSGTDRFQVISYTPTNKEAILVLEGQARQGSTVKSTTRLQAKIPFDQTTKPSFNPPGAWAENFGLGNNEILGDVMDAACPPGSLSSSELSNIKGKVNNDAALFLPLPLTVPNLCTVGLVYGATCGARSLSAITNDLTLPDITHTPNVNGEYVYYVNVNVSGTNSIELGGNSKLIIKPDKKVTLYLQGNINTQGGGVKIGHNCYDSITTPDGEPDGTTQVPGCTPDSFQIYGGTGTTSIIFGGSNTVDAFIFAPKAVDSGVNGGAQIRGSIWIKEWDAANGNHQVIVQTAAWNNIPPSLWPPKLSPLSSWQRQEIP